MPTLRKLLVSGALADRQQRKALPCRYYHIIFTLPQELNVLWRFNRSPSPPTTSSPPPQPCTGSTAIPSGWAADQAHWPIGKSWGETLNTHPHLHVLITAGGLTPKGGWQDARQDYLLPTAVLGPLSGAALGSVTHGAVQNTHPTATTRPDPGSMECHPQPALLSLKWHIQIQPPYRHPNGLILYLAYYLRGGPISEHRLHAGPQGLIQIDYKRPAEHQTQRCSLSVREFLARFLTHIPPRAACVWHVPGTLPSPRTGGLCTSVVSAQRTLCHAFRHHRGRAPRKERALLSYPLRLPALRRHADHPTPTQSTTAGPRRMKSWSTTLQDSPAAVDRSVLFASRLKVFRVNTVFQSQGQTAPPARSSLKQRREPFPTLAPPYGLRYKTLENGRPTRGWWEPVPADGAMYT